MQAIDYRKLEELPPLYATDEIKGDLLAVKLFTPDANATWILWEYDPAEKMAFGLCNLGLGEAALGYVSIEEIEAIRGQFGLPVERERYTLTRFAGYRAMGEEVPDYLVSA